VPLDGTPVPLVAIEGPPTSDAEGAPVVGLQLHPAPAPSAVSATASPSSAPEVSAATLAPPSAKPEVIRSAGVLIKWGAITAGALVVAFISMRFLVPFLQELNHPSKPAAGVDKNASTAVQMLQQTRQAVAKNDAKVDALNEVVAVVENKPVVTPPPSPAPVVRAPVPIPAPTKVDLSQFQAAVDQLKVDAVTVGDSPRALIGGRFFKAGDLIDRKLGLKFIGANATEHTLLFSNLDNAVFRKHY
jgi:hypothetical protein